MLKVCNIELNLYEVMYFEDVRANRVLLTKTVCAESEDEIVKILDVEIKRISRICPVDTLLLTQKEIRTALKF